METTTSQLKVVSGVAESGEGTQLFVYERSRDVAAAGTRLVELFFFCCCCFVHNKKCLELSRPDEPSAESRQRSDLSGCRSHLHIFAVTTTFNNYQPNVFFLSLIISFPPTPSGFVVPPHPHV